MDGRASNWLQVEEMYAEQLAEFVISATFLPAAVLIGVGQLQRKQLPRSSPEPADRISNSESAERPKNALSKICSFDCGLHVCSELR